MYRVQSRHNRYDTVVFERGHEVFLVVEYRGFLASRQRFFLRPVCLRIGLREIDGPTTS
jgi:hypothetical protein